MSVNNSENEALPPEQNLSDKNKSRSELWSQFLKNEKVQLIQQNSQQYLCYFLKTLAHPYRTMTLSESDRVFNAAISVGLVSILSALYCFIWFCKLGLSSSFGVGFFKPLLLTALGLSVACVLIYAVLRIEKITVSPKLLMNRFSDLLMPAIVALLFSIILLLIGMHLFSSLLFVTAYISVFAGMNVLMLQYPLNARPGLIDSFYLILAVNLITGYIFYKLIASIIFSAMGGFSIF